MQHRDYWAQDGIPRPAIKFSWWSVVGGALQMAANLFRACAYGLEGFSEICFASANHKIERAAMEDQATREIEMLTSGKYNEEFDLDEEWGDE